MYLWVNMLSMMKNIKLDPEAVIVEVSRKDNLVGKFVRVSDTSDIYYVVETSKARIKELKAELGMLSPNLEFMTTARPPAKRSWHMIGSVGSRKVGYIRD